MRLHELKLVSGGDKAAVADLAEILSGQSEGPPPVLSVVSPDHRQDEDPDDAA